MFETSGCLGLAVQTCEDDLHNDEFDADWTG